MLFTIVVFVIILGLLVFVHELGHFATARKLGVKAEEFGFGFPPRICGWKKINGKRIFFLGNKDIEHIKSEDTVYSFNWIPLGGFVKIKGEDGENKSDQDSFAGKKIWKRAVILSAGVFMNVVLCAVCLMIAFSLGAPQVVDGMDTGAVIENQKIQVVSLTAFSPAKEAGVNLGDAILKLDDQQITSIEQIQEYVSARDGQSIQLTVERYGEELTIAVVPQMVEEIKNAGLGVGLAETGIVSYPWYKAIWLGIKGTYFMAVKIIVAFALVIKNAVTGQPLGVDVAGPVGIAVMTGQVARMGFIYILQFTALLSLNLAIINFLPFPALDGGRVLFLIIEKIKGSAVNQKVEQIVHTIGFVLLMVLIIVVTGRDIYKFKEFFVELWQKII